MPSKTSRGYKIRVIEEAAVISNRVVAQNTFVTRFHSPEVARTARPGQFVMVSFPECLDPLLARAFSVSDVHGEDFSLLYSAVGKGTTRLSRLKRGAIAAINGPLGNGFPEVERGENIWLVVGGSGAAIVPIVFKSARRAGAALKIFYGAKTKLQIVAFKKIQFYAATDDGSAGHHGTVLDLLNIHFRKEKPSKIFGCGPTAMLAALKKNIDTDVPLYISVETPMACGMGFCQGCPVKVVDSSEYLLACKNGPVFDAREIDLE